VSVRIPTDGPFEELPFGFFDFRINLRFRALAFLFEDFQAKAKLIPSLFVPFVSLLPKAAQNIPSIPSAIR
jgi:hypothetical protein